VSEPKCGAPSRTRGLPNAQKEIVPSMSCMCSAYASSLESVHTDDVQEEPLKKLRTVETADMLNLNLKNLKNQFLCCIVRVNK